MRKRAIVLMFTAYSGVVVGCGDVGQGTVDPPMEVIGFFSSSYLGARSAFLEAASAQGARIDSIRHPLLGPSGEPLFTDVAVLGPSNASAWVVLSSGTHGVEGFAGSALQTGLLQTGRLSCRSDSVGVLMIHAINPYGFAHLRRWNEDNVDLNRNFVDHTKTHATNKGYRELAGVVEPKSLSFWSDVNFWRRVLWYRLRHGSDSLKTALTGGQYTHPQGLFYGGLEETWSNRTLREIMSRYLSAATSVVMVDFHTGLGEYGSAEIIMNVPPDSPAFGRAVKLWGDSAVRSTVSGESVSADLSGTVKLAVPRMLTQAEVTAVSLEFGTLSSTRVFRALRAENWMYHHGNGDHPDAQQVRADLLEAFYPEAVDWKAAVWQHGTKLVAHALGCAAQHPGDG